MEAVCKTEPGKRELWEVAHRGKDCPGWWTHLCFICARVLLVAQLEEFVLIPPAQDRRPAKPSCLAPTSYEIIFQHCIYLKHKFSTLVSDKDTMKDMTRSRRNALVLIVTCCGLSVTWPLTWNLTSLCRSVALKLDKWNVYSNLIFTVFTINFQTHPYS